MNLKLTNWISVPTIIFRILFILLNFNELNNIIQAHYQQWIEKQSTEVKKQVPKKLYWGQADWFFDGEGIGLHYRANEISKDAPQLDIYLSTEQSKQMLQPEIYQQMF